MLRVVGSQPITTFVGWRSMKEQLNNRKVAQQVTDRCCVCVMQSVSEFWLLPCDLRTYIANHEQHHGRSRGLRLRHR